MKINKSDAMQRHDRHRYNSNTYFKRKQNTGGPKHNTHREEEKIENQEVRKALGSQKANRQRRTQTK